MSWDLVLYARADSDALGRSLDSCPGGHDGVPSRDKLLYGDLGARVAFRPGCFGRWARDEMVREFMSADKYWGYFGKGLHATTEATYACVQHLRG
eukprot:m51a1_g8339 hypothetical protein (95) ;mRNA; f:5759-8381